jgi:hypothetical protein
LQKNNGLNSIFQNEANNRIIYSFTKHFEFNFSIFDFLTLFHPFSSYASQLPLSASYSIAIWLS